VNIGSFDILTAMISDISPVRHIGKVSRLDSGGVYVVGLSRVAGLGELIEVACAKGARVRAEIISMSENTVFALPLKNMAGIIVGDPVRLLPKFRLCPDNSWMGRVIDPFGLALDGRPLLKGTDSVLSDPAPLSATQRRRLGMRLQTGIAIFDTFLPLARGQRIGLFAGSGVGKSMLLGRLARQIDTDVIVMALIGERGREVGDFIERTLGPEGMKRTVMVVATSDQSPLVKRRAAWTAMAVAEYFRDQGKQVLYLADSITRFAEAHREVAIASGEPSTARGFPASTQHMITALCERAGTGVGDFGDITAVFSVLVAGSDMDEPIADIIRGVLDGHVVLSREIAERGRFPAVDIVRSVSRSLPEAAADTENSVLRQARDLLGAYDSAALMIQSGLYERGGDERLDRAVSLNPAFEAFATLVTSESIEHSFERLSKILEPASTTQNDQDAPQAI